MTKEEEAKVRGEEPGADGQEQQQGSGYTAGEVTRPAVSRVD